MHNVVPPFPIDVLARSLPVQAGALPGASVMPLGIRIETHTTLSELTDLASDWQDLYGLIGRPTPFQSFCWAHACARYLNSGTDGHQLCIKTVWQGQRLVGVAPWVRSRSFGLGALRWLGGPLTIYGDVLSAPDLPAETWLPAVLDDVAQRREAHVVFLENVAENGHVWSYLTGAGQHVGGETAPYLDMVTAGSFERWRQCQSRSSRKSRGRRWRSLNERGDVAFAFEPYTPDKAGSLDSLFAMKAHWADHNAVISRTIGDQNFEATVRAVVAGGGTDARLSTLSLNGQAVAIELGFVSGQRYCSYLGAYDPRFKEFSPGALQCELTLKACFDDGLEVFDLLPPGDAYKFVWASAVNEIRHSALALTRLGHLQVRLARARPTRMAKAMLNRLPGPYRRFVQRMSEIL